MEGRNIYKPRYKISFLSKSKVWIYKDSRLRRFFNIRGRKLIRRGLFKRYILVFNNMKWTVARRYIRPVMWRRKTPKRRYKTAFYNKQQLRHFYGKFKEEAFRNLFRAHLVGVASRNKSFSSTLERRIDMFLFRARHIPTFYAANQFVQHQGVEHNGSLDKAPSALVGPGNSLIFDSYFWELFSDHLYNRIDFRYYGKELLKKRIFYKLKKKVRRLLRRRKRKSRKLVFYSQLQRKIQSISELLLEVVDFFVNKRFPVYGVPLEKNPETSKLELNPLNLSYLINAWKYKHKNHVTTLLFELDTIEQEHLNLREANLFLSQKLLKVRSRLRLRRLRFRRIKNFKLKAKLRKLRWLRKRKRRKLKRLKFRRRRTKFIWRRKRKWICVRRQKKGVKGKSWVKRKIWIKRKAHTIKRLKLKKRNKKGRIFQIRKRKKYVSKFKASKQKKVKVYIFKQLKCFFSLYTRIMNLFLLDREPFIQKNFNVLRNRLDNAWKVLIRYEKVYHDALELNRQNKLRWLQVIPYKVKYKKQKKKVKALIALYNQASAYEKQFKDRVNLIKEKFTQIAEFFIESCRNKRMYKRWRTRNRIKIKTKKDKNGELKKEEKEETHVRRNGIFYFIIGRKFKRRKRRNVPRLNLVHWYVPAYIYFNSNTMESMMLHDPQLSEIFYSFKCSLPKIHAFYRARGL